MSETKGDYTFEHFSTSVTGRLSIMISTKESIPGGNMVFGQSFQTPFKNSE